MARDVSASAPLRKALGTDNRLVARWVALHGEQCQCAEPDYGWTARCQTCHRRVFDGYSVSQIANWLGVGDGKVAIAMKYAKAAGYVKRKVTDEGDLLIPTQLALDTFPPDRPHVVEEPEAVQVGDSGTFTPISTEEIRSTDAELERRQQAGLGGGMVDDKRRLGSGS